MTKLANFAAATIRYRVNSGDCLPLSVQLTDTEGEIVDLTGYESTLTIFSRSTEIELSTDNGDLEIDEDDNTISGEMTAGQTEDFAGHRPVEFRWTVTQPDGCVRSFLQGIIEVIE